MQFFNVKTVPSPNLYVVIVYFRVKIHDSGRKMKQNGLFKEKKSDFWQKWYFLYFHGYDLVCIRRFTIVLPNKVLLPWRSEFRALWISSMGTKSHFLMENKSIYSISWHTVWYSSNRRLHIQKLSFFNRQTLWLNRGLCTWTSDCYALWIAFIGTKSRFLLENKSFSSISWNLAK